MIPDFIDIGATWKVLPPGVHAASLEEVRHRFGTNEVRLKLYDGLFQACQALRSAGCEILYLDGSYITDKPIPEDFDACWQAPSHFDEIKLDPVFYDFSNTRANQKKKFGGEFFPAFFLADEENPFLLYFQIDKETGSQKGIICIHLKD